MTDTIRVLLQESATAVETSHVEVNESTPATEAVPVPGKPGRFLIQIISAGKGASGTYSPETIKAAVEAKVWGPGLQTFMDHPGATEAYDRPERSIRDLAGTLAEYARWDEGLQSAVAEATVYAPFRPLLAEAANDIGVSIRALAEAKPGDDGPIITKITEALSVDYVTKAGRGGRIMQVLESARVVEAATEDERDMLQRALPQRSWLRDFDPDARLVWFSRYDDMTDRSSTWQQEYSQDGTTATLTGTPVEVRQVTTYQPLAGSTDPSTAAVETATQNPPAGSAGVTPIKENHMEITEAEHAALTDRAARVDALEAELATRDAIDAAHKRVVAPLAESSLPEGARARVLNDVTRMLPLTEANTLDEARFDKAVTEAIEAEKTYIAGLTPQRSVTGFGTVTESATTGRPRVNPWGRTSTQGA